MKKIISVYALLAVFLTASVFLSLTFGADEPGGSRGIRPVEHKDIETADRAEWHAFLVGVRFYRSEVGGLTYTLEDVKELESRLIALGVKKENITTLYDGEVPYETLPTKANIEEKFQDFIDNLTPESVAFVYLSGHGFNLPDESGDKSKTRSFFMPADVRADARDPSQPGKRLGRRDSLVATSISVNDMLSELASSQAKFRWLNVDACRTDLSNIDLARVGELAQERDPQFEITNVPSGVILLQSCSFSESSYEGINPTVAKEKSLTENVDANPEYRHGLFTKALLEALPDLSGKSPVADIGHDGKGPDGNVTLIETLEYIKKRVQDESYRYHNARQTPCWRFDEETGFDDFALFTRLPVYDVSYDKWEAGSKDREEAIKLRDAGQYDVALKKIQTARNLIPNAPGIEEEEAEITRLRDEANAQEYYKDAQEAEQKGQYDLALTHVQNALALAPNARQYKDLETSLKATISEIKRQEDEKRRQEEERKRKEKAEEAYKYSGKLYDDRLYDNALEAINQALEGDSENVEYQRRKRAIEQAIQLREQGKKRQEDGERAYEEAGKLYDDGDYKTALNSIKKALEIDPNNAGYKRLEKSINDAIKLREKPPVSVRSSPASTGSSSTSTTASTPKRNTPSRTSTLTAQTAGASRTVMIAGVETKFRWCPPGKFTMGSPTSESQRDPDEKQHEVTLSKGFWLCEVPVTVSAFRKFANASGYKTEAEKAGDEYTWQSPGWSGSIEYSFEQTPLHPVVNVSWNDAQAYIKWLNSNYAPSGMEFKLPTEAQWEYACRAGSRTAYWWGDNPEDGKGKANVADASAKKKFSNWTTFSFDDGFVYTSPVGSFAANNWGLKDMTGNVWEWCADWYGDYPQGAVTDPTGAQTGGNRVLRGGSWNLNPGGCRSASRGDSDPANRGEDCGFRLLLTDK